MADQYNHPENYALGRTRTMVEQPEERQDSAKRSRYDVSGDDAYLQSILDETGKEARFAVVSLLGIFNRFSAKMIINWVQRNLGTEQRFGLEPAPGMGPYMYEFYLKQRFGGPFVLHFLEHGYKDAVEHASGAYVQEVRIAKFEN